METMLETFKALSDKNRVRIVAALSRYEELCACQITQLLQVTGATASRHLSVLQHAGLVSSRKDGRWIYYRLECPAEAEPVLEWLRSSIAQSKLLQADLASLQEILAVTREELCRMQRGEICCPK
jgi:ArsR family transcriptional regulator